MRLASKQNDSPFAQKVSGAPILSKAVSYSRLVVPVLAPAHGIWPSLIQFEKLGKAFCSASWLHYSTPVLFTEAVPKVLRVGVIKEHPDRIMKLVLSDRGLLISISPRVQKLLTNHNDPKRAECRLFIRTDQNAMMIESFIRDGPRKFDRVFYVHFYSINEKVHHFSPFKPKMIAQKNLYFRADVCLFGLFDFRHGKSFGSWARQ